MYLIMSYSKLGPIKSGLSVLKIAPVHPQPQCCHLFCAELCKNTQDHPSICCHSTVLGILSVSTLRLRQNGCHFPDDTFRCIFLNENIHTLLKNLLKFVPNAQMNNIPSLVPIMAWRRLGDKPLSEQTMVSLLMHICVTRPQWVKYNISHKTCTWFCCAFLCFGYVLVL